jgi:hypothetical protein
MLTVLLQPSLIQFMDKRRIQRPLLYDNQTSKKEAVKNSCCCN